MVLNKDMLETVISWQQVYLGWNYWIPDLFLIIYPAEGREQATSTPFVKSHIAVIVTIPQ